MIAADAFRSNDFLPPEDGKVYTAGDVNRIELTAGLFSPLTGYLFHNPPRFAPIPGVLTQSEIDAAVADWPEFVKRSLTKIRETSNRIAEVACKVRDPWLPIKPLLARPDPLSPVYQGLDRWPQTGRASSVRRWPAPATIRPTSSCRCLVHVACDGPTSAS